MTKPAPAPVRKNAPSDDLDDIDPDTSGDEDNGQTAKSGLYRVLVGAITVWENKAKKASIRYPHAAKVKLDANVHDIDRLLALRAIEPYSKTESIGRTTAPHLVAAARKAAQDNELQELPDGRPSAPSAEDLGDDVEFLGGADDGDTPSGPAVDITDPNAAKPAPASS